MRIIAGKRRGLKLAEVGDGDAAAHLRPTSDRVRESLFNVLTGGRFGDPVTGARVLDLFAGTGALGLEAWSRGAADVTLVDNGRVAGRLIAENVKRAGAGGEVRLVAKDATRLGPCEGGAATLVFLDPPYGGGAGSGALAAAASGGWIAPGALVVWEDAGARTAPPGFDFLEARRYGGTHVTLLRAQASQVG